jgi:HSP20 family protein
MNFVKNHNHFSNVVLNDFLNRSISDIVGSDLSNSYPAVNIHEDDNNFEIALAAPGLAKEDFQIQLDKNQLTISAKKEAEQKTEGTRYTRREFNYSAFKRNFTLPEHIDKSNIKANYQNGVLELLVPKKAEAKFEARQIVVA